MIHIPLKEHVDFINAVLRHAESPKFDSPELLLNYIAIACHEEINKHKIADLKRIEGTVTDAN